MWWVQTQSLTSSMGRLDIWEEHITNRASIKILLWGGGGYRKEKSTLNVERSSFQMAAVNC